VRAHLDLLQAAEFVYETRLFPLPEYTFKHALTQQVAYEGQLHDRRRELHASILLALEATTGQATAERSERLAHHAVRGEEWEKAYRHAMDAGLRAAALNAHRSALEAFETAADALARLPQTEERLGEAVDLRFHMRDALFVLGDRLKVRAQMDVAERLSLQLRDRKRLVSVLLYQSGFHWSEGRHREHALPIARRAYALASEAGDREDVGLSCYRLASAHTLLGEYRDATRWAEEGLGALEPQAGTLFRFGGLVYTFLASFDAMARAELGDFAGADRVGRRGYELAVAADHAYSETVSAFGLTHSLLLQGRVGEALPILERGLNKIAIHGVQAAAPWVAGRAAYAFASVGREADFDRAVDLVRSSTDLSPSMRHGFAFTWAARGCLALGRFEQAAELGLRALRNPTPDPERGVHAWAHWVLGEAARNASPADLDAAGRAYEAASDLACELGMRALEAHCWFGKARIAAQRGGREAADAHARRAREIAGNIGLAPDAEASWLPHPA
jgi:tetratricopeptide (TPR) repeat protein